MYERFTDRARKVMQLANQEAQRFNHEYIGTEHILLGLVKEGSGVAGNVLKNLDVDLRKIRLEVEKIVQGVLSGDSVTLGQRPHTPRAKKVIEYSVEEARLLNHNYVGTEHLLLGLLREQEGVAAQVLMNLGLKLEDVREEVLNLLGHNLPEAREPGIGWTDDIDERPAKGKSRTPALDSFGRDLTELARQGKLATLVGREAELSASCEVLACRSRNNPVLLGEPGVGKTTLVAGLAKAIVDGRAPDWLHRHRIVELPLSPIWSDAHDWKGVSNRARAIFNEVRRARDTVLFLPAAIASLASNPSASPAEIVRSELLLALRSAQVPCILVATPQEYHRCRERRPALESLVQLIRLRPATVDETVAVLRGIRDRYEAHHRVGITDEALTAAAESADRLPGALPGKAVRLLDRAAARYRIRAGMLSPEAGAALRDLDAEIERVNHEKEEAIAATDFPLAAERRNQADALQKEKERLLRERQERSAQVATVDAATVAEVARDLAAEMPPSGPATA